MVFGISEQRSVGRNEVVAFGGWLYSIAKWLPEHVRHHSAPLRGFTNRWCESFASKITRPTTVVGFSEGANAAMMVAAYSPMVRLAIVHSCEDKSFEFNRRCDYRFFLTKEDKTPTAEGTRRTAVRASNAQISHELKVLCFEPFESPTLFERKVLTPRFHIFHNVLPQLPKSGIYL